VVFKKQKAPQGASGLNITQKMMNCKKLFYKKMSGFCRAARRY